jgi:hypothetical protein
VNSQEVQPDNYEQSIVEMKSRGLYQASQSQVAA